MNNNALITDAKRWQLGAGTDSSRLRLLKAEKPSPRFGEVVVRMRAASLNYRDLLLAENPQIQNRVPLSDGAGEVVALGEGVSEWKVGDRVCPTFFRDWRGGRFRNEYHDAALGGSVDGVLSEFFTSPAHGLTRIPDHFSFEEAATLPCAGLTAWYALRRGGYMPGDSVLLQGTGGVSIWGLQIVVASGGTAIITSSSDEKLDRAREMGASHGINYRTTPDWDKEVSRITGKRGVDHVLEVGGPQTLEKSLASVASGGHIAQIGVLTGQEAAPTSMLPLMFKNAILSGIYVGDRESFENFTRFLEATKIQPIIDKTFAFDDAPAAYETLRSGAHFGKVVISI